MSKFIEVDPTALSDNPFKIIGKDWMLVSAGDEQKFNTMTASWGSVGIMWNKPVSFIFIRPQRYTLEFVESNDYYTLSFFPGEEYRKALAFCGSKSGRDYDKCKETGLTPVFDEGTPYFEQARLVMVCKKLYSQPLSEEYVIQDFVKDNYENDYHKMFVGEIVKVLVKED